MNKEPEKPKHLVCANLYKEVPRPKGLDQDSLPLITSGEAA